MRGLQRRLEHLEEITGVRYSVEQPRKRKRQIVSGFGWTPNPEKPGGCTMAPLDLGKSSCVRTFYPDGTLNEWIHIYGCREDLSDEELERWIATKPVRRVDSRGRLLPGEPDHEEPDIWSYV